MQLTFSPGSGGVPSGQPGGGGGGGVMVNGIGPSGDEGDGEGYGAGGCLNDGDFRDGHAGVIILENKSNP